MKARADNSSLGKCFARPARASTEYRADSPSPLNHKIKSTESFAGTSTKHGSIALLPSTAVTETAADSLLLPCDVEEDEEEETTEDASSDG